MIIRLTLPAKTFVLGEYAVLQNSAALILCTEPRFQLLAKKNITKSSNYIGIASQSPAGKWLAKEAFYQQYQLEFKDPYSGIGGLGASSAQFGLVYALQHPIKTDADRLQALEAYQQLAWDGQGIKPSGADLVAQLKGGLCYFNRASQTLETFTWPFDSAEFCLIHTGQKIATHVHLQGLREIDFTDFSELVELGAQSIKQKNLAGFAEAMQRYGEKLQAKKLVAEHTQLLLKKILQQPGVYAAKGCGALGADVIFVLLAKQQAQSFVAWALAQALKILTTGDKVSGGVLMDSAKIS